MRERDNPTGEFYRKEWAKNQEIALHCNIFYHHKCYSVKFCYTLLRKTQKPDSVPNILHETCETHEKAEKSLTARCSLVAYCAGFALKKDVLLKNVKYWAGSGEFT